MTKLIMNFDCNPVNIIKMVFLCGPPFGNLDYRKIDLTLNERKCTYKTIHCLNKNSMRI